MAGVTAPATPLGSAQLPELEASLLRGLSLARLAVFAWMVVVVIVARNDVANPWVAWGGLGVIGVWSLWEFARVRAPMTQRFAGIVTVIETGLAAALLIADPWVWTSTVGQRYASAWPLMPVLAAAIIWERRGGLVAALTLGAVNAVALAGLAFVGELARLADAGGQSLSIASTVALWLVAGLAAGAVVERLGRAERRVAQAEVREEMARELHDGVLQTLAVVQRRSTDSELSRLARDQELDLRSWLFGDDDLAGPELALGPALRDVARRAERTHRLRVQVVGVGLDEDAGGGTEAAVDPSIIAALAGAAGEAMTNAAKHGNAGAVTLYVELDDDAVFVSVKDDGAGFDVEGAEAGIGMSQSITGRIEAVGGRVGWRSTAPHGAEVSLTVPLTDGRNQRRRGAEPR
jgi:signal transduction histidine kinase